MRIESTFAGVLVALALVCQPVAAQPGGAQYGVAPYGTGQYSAYPAGAPTQAATQQPAAIPATAPNYQLQSTGGFPNYQAAPTPGQVAVAPATPSQVPNGQPPIGYGTPTQGYVRVAQAPAAVQNLPAPTEAIGSAPIATPSVMGGTPVAPMAPAVANYNGAVASGDCGCNTAPAANWQSYMPAASGCATGGCATGGCAAPGCGGYDDCATTCYAPAGCDYVACDDYCNTRPRRQWFAGLYGLYMGRDNPGKVNSTVLVDPEPAGIYYPQPGVDVFFTSAEADVDFVGGAEIRFGSTFGCATDPCGCTTYQPFAWEVGYWALDEDSSFAEVTDTFGGTSRLYGMINYAGLEYDRDGAGATYGYRSVNDYYDHQAPIGAPAPPRPVDDVRVLAVRVTQSFEVQNLELNFWRFGAPAVGAANTCGCSTGGGLGSGAIRNAIGGLGGGCGQGACGSACGPAACGGGVANCAPCGCGSPCAAPAPRRRFFINGIAGVRYLKMDETFRNAVFFTNGADVTVYPGSMPATDQVLFHDIQTENDLLGFQLGSSMNCLVGCRWTLFCDTNFGIYGNDIDQYQRVFSPGGGDVRFVGSTNDAAVRSSKTDVAFLGEARCGVGFQVSPRCRLTTAYRAIAISGVALAPSQIRTPVNEAVFGHIDSNDSIIIHGFQGGVEFKY